MVKNNFINSSPPSVIVTTEEDIKSIIIDALHEVFPLGLSSMIGPPQEEEKDELLTREEAAEILHANLSTLWRWSKTGYLPCIKLGRNVRYKLSAVRHFLEQNQC